MSWVQEFRLSIKPPEAEDGIDLAFYRPLGFVVAKMSWSAGLHPTHLTLLGALAGSLAGALFFIGHGTAFLAAALLFLVAGVLDSADGQLARLSGRSTPFGLVLDGLCDNIVFSAVYIGCTIPLMERYGWWIWALAVPAGFCHSLQSSILDFYNREYLYYTGGPSRDGYWNPLVSEMRGSRDWFARLRISWIYQQELLSTRPPTLRLSLRRERSKNGNMAFIYRKHNLRLLHFWRPLGANVHTLAIILFAAIGRFELYLFFIDIVLLNLWLCVAAWTQSWADKEMLAELHEKAATRASG